VVLDKVKRFSEVRSKRVNRKEAMKFIKMMMTIPSNIVIAVVRLINDDYHFLLSKTVLVDKIKTQIKLMK
jgi:hypothetical protein